MELIGQGFHSEIYRFDEEHCVKKINLYLEDVKNVVEMDVLNRLQHPNILRAESFWFEYDTDKLCYKTKFYKDNLIDYVNRNPSINARIKLMFQLLSAINFLHENQICHGDIRLTNIMIDNEDAILIDFGLARTINQEKFIAQNTKENFRRSDIFMLGSIFTFILTGQKLLPPEEYQENLQTKIKNFLNNPEKKLNKYDLEPIYFDLIFNMMINETYASDLLKHKIFSNQTNIIGSKLNLESKKNPTLDYSIIYSQIKEFMLTCIKENYPTYILYHTIDLFYAITSRITELEYNLDTILIICFRLTIKLLSSGPVSFVNNHDACRKPERYCLKLLNGILLRENYFTVSKTLIQLINALDYLLDHNYYFVISPSEFINNNQTEEMLRGITKYCGCMQLYLNYLNMKNKKN